MSTLRVTLPRLCVSVLVMGLQWPLAALAGSHSGESNVTTVDTRDNAIVVSGRVLAGADRRPISGAAVSLAGQNTTTSGSGQFSFPSVSLSVSVTRRTTVCGRRVRCRLGGWKRPRGICRY